MSVKKYYCAWDPMFLIVRDGCHRNNWDVLALYICSNVLKGATAPAGGQVVQHGTQPVEVVDWVVTGDDLPSFLCSSSTKKGNEESKHCALYTALFISTITLGLFQESS